MSFDADKLNELLKQYEKSLSCLKEALALPKTRINVGAAIQFFEMTFEVGWKLMQGVALFHGKIEDAKSPRNAIRYAAYINLIDDPEKWLEFLEKRNLTTHTYNELMAQEVYEAAQKFVAVAEKLPEKVKEAVR